MTIGAFMKRNVVSIPASATVGDAAAVFVAHHVGLLPVVDDENRLAGVLGLQDLLDLELPAFVRLVEDVDFVHDFGAVETTRPSAASLARPVKALMHPATTVKEDCGLIRAYALMLQRKLHDLPVVTEDGRLIGIASRVDVGTAILRSWQALGERAP